MRKLFGGKTKARPLIPAAGTKPDRVLSQRQVPSIHDFYGTRSHSSQGTRSPAPTAVDANRGGTYVLSLCPCSPNSYKFPYQH